MTKTKPYIVGIAGPSGSGKTLLALELRHRMRKRGQESNIAILSEDNYYLDRSNLEPSEREALNYDHPSAFEHSLLFEHITAISKGTPIKIPQYDFARHVRQAEGKILDPAPILIIEGILLFHHRSVRELMDLKVFVDVPADICLARRIERDTQERGRPIQSVLRQYEQSVRPMFLEFVEPSKKHADLIVPHGGKNLRAQTVIENHLSKTPALLDQNHAQRRQ